MKEPNQPLELHKKSDLLSTEGYKRVRQAPMPNCIKCGGTGIRKKNKKGREFYCDCMNRLS